MQSLSNMQQIAAGYEHAIALKKDGTVYVWGSNIYGQLSLDDNNSNKNEPYELTELKNVKQVAAGGNSTAVIKEDGTA
jgi:alpha-tubulin suppressor-like RCC1 family protein